MKEIEEATANTWVSTGAIKPTSYGSENTYYVNEFGHEFYCKNYPDTEICTAILIMKNMLDITGGPDTCNGETQKALQQMQDFINAR